MRLAHEQGIIHQPELNQFQQFALLYWIYLSKRQANESMRDHLEIQCFNLFFDRWKEVYSGRSDSILDRPEADEEGEPVLDLDEIEAFYSNLDRTRIMSGAEAMDTSPWDFEAQGLPPADAEWGDWA